MENRSKWILDHNLHRCPVPLYAIISLITYHYGLPSYREMHAGFQSNNYNRQFIFYCLPYRRRANKIASNACPFWAG